MTLLDARHALVVILAAIFLQKVDAAIVDIDKDLAWWLDDDE